MPLKSTTACIPFALLLSSTAAHAGLEPFSFGASETVGHQSNINHSDVDVVSDWYSTTEVNGALNEPVGRGALTGSAAVDLTRYRDYSPKNSTGYRAALGLDWATVGDLSGSLGGDSSRRQYLYGLQGDTRDTAGDNEETDNHVYARATLGGTSRWTIYGGFDGASRDFSASSFASNEERQWSQSLGTRYSTSPDLSFGLVANYLRGEYPHYGEAAVKADFTSKSVSATTKLQASGNSAFDASLGYTTQNSDIQSPNHFVSGSLNWSWTPPSHFGFNLGIARSANGGAVSSNPSSLNDRSLNTSANLNVTYELTAKVNFLLSGQYIKRKYSGVLVPVIESDGNVGFESLSGSSHTARVAFTAHYQPTRTTDVSCTAARERLSAADAAVESVTPSYSDNTFQCGASISFK